MKKKILFLLILFIPFMVSAEELNLEWEKGWGGSYGDSFNSIALLEDGGFVAVGSTSSNNIDGIDFKGVSDAIIVRYDKDGNIIWQKNYGGSSYDVFNSSLQVKDYGFIVIGDTLSENIDGLTCKGYDSDVSVEVLFKEILSNPKTGVFDYISFIMIGLLISFIGYISISYNNQKFEL